MRIMYVVQHFSGPRGHSSSRPYEIARRLVAKGHEVVLLCGRYSEGAPGDIDAAANVGIRIIQAPIAYDQKMNTPQRALSFARYMRWAIRTGRDLKRPDLVYASSTPLTVGEVGRKVARHHGAPFVFEVRDLWPEELEALGALGNPIVRWQLYSMARRIYASADHVVALSTGMRDGILRWGVPEGAVSVVTNFSYTTEFGGAAAREGWRARYGWRDKLVCIHPGAMGRVNGLDYLVDCAKALDAAGEQGIEIALLGSGDQKARLQTRIADEGVRSTGVLDPIPRTQMPALLAAADVGLVTIVPLEGLNTHSSNKFFDFLAAGKPVVINYGGWQEAVLRQHGAGTAVDGNAPQEMMRELVRLRDDPEARARMGRAARLLAEAEYDCDLQVNRLESTLRGLAGARQETAWSGIGR